jgi:hypothetical protein
MSFIFSLFVVHWHSNLMFPCSNLTVDMYFYLQKNINSFCFVKFTNYTKYYLVCSPLELLFLRPGIINKMSRILEPQLRMSLILTWTQRSNLKLRRTNFAVNKPLLI